MSLSSFHRHFLAVTSLSPLQFQKQLRLIEARRLMMAEGMSASRAAFSVGYGSVPQFTREYRRMFGLPPVRDADRPGRGGGEKRSASSSLMSPMRQPRQAVRHSMFQSILSRVNAAAAATSGAVKIATAHQGYAYGKVYGGLERRGIDPVIPAKKEPVRAKVPLRRFRYDARQDVLRRLRGKMLRPGKPVAHGRLFHSTVRDCSKCDLASIAFRRGGTRSRW